MSDVSSQMLPETLNRIELWRVGRQTHQLNTILMSLQKSKHRFSKMNPIVVDDDVDLACLRRSVWLNELSQDSAKQGVVLMITGRPRELAAHPVDESCPIAFLVFARRLDHLLLTSFAPAARDGRQGRQVNLILVIQIDFSCLGLSLQRLDSAHLALIFGIRAFDAQDGTQQLILMLVQVITHTTLIQSDSCFRLQVLGKQGSGPIRERATQGSGI